MSEHPIESMMASTMQKIREMADVNTIIGDPINTPDGTTIIPISKISYGFGAGGSDFPSKKTDENLFGGGSGAGITLSPVAILTVKDGEVKLLQVEPFHSSVDKAIEMIPGMFDKIKALFKKGEKSDKPPKNKIKKDNLEYLNLKEEE
jgi:sporulation protein YtfJ